MSRKVLRDASAGVELEPLSMRHVSPRYGKWFGDAEVCRDNRHGKKALTAGQIRAYIRSLAKDKTIQAFAILHGENRAHIGNISLNSISPDGSAEISILIGEKSAWGKGAGLAACRLVRDYAFKDLGLHRVWMGMTARNEAMIRIAEKLGMIREAVRRDAFLKNGRYHDLVEYAMVRSSKTGQRVILLTKYGNIMGLEYLAAFRREGIRLEAVVFQGDSFDEKDHRIVMDRTEGRYQPLFAGDVLNRPPFSIYYVRKHNSPECLQLLRALKPDVLLLGGADILPEGVLHIPTRGTLNCHPGMLPEYRGCSCVEWAIYNGDPVAATCHTASAKIDWGASIYSEILPIPAGQTYPEVRARMIGHQARVMIEGVRRFLGKKGPWPLMSSAGRYWKTMGPEELARVKEKLAKGEYSCQEKALCRSKES